MSWNVKKSPRTRLNLRFWERDGDRYLVITDEREIDGRWYTQKAKGKVVTMPAKVEVIEGLISALQKAKEELQDDVPF